MEYQSFNQIQYYLQVAAVETLKSTLIDAGANFLLNPTQMGKEPAVELALEIKKEFIALNS